MFSEKSRRRGFLAGTVAAVSGLAGCAFLGGRSGQSDSNSSTGPSPQTTNSPSENVGNEETSSEQPVPSHDHSGENSGGASLAPDVLSVTEFSQSPSYTIYKRDGKVRALNAATQREQFSDGDARTVIQEAIDALDSGGIVHVKAGTYRIGPESIELRSGTRLVGEGIRATTLKVKGGLNDRADRFYVVHAGRGVEGASVANLEIDGNESNNRNISPFPESPHSHGISIEAIGDVVRGDDKPARITVRNVYVHDTIRSNVVVTGRHCELENLWLENAATDHWLYMAGAEYCNIRSVHASGFARGGGIALGVGKRPCRYNTLSQVVIEDATTTPFEHQPPGGLGGRYPVNAINFRRSNGNAHHNTIRDLRIRPSETGFGHALRILQSDTTVEDVEYEGGLRVGPLVKVRPNANGTTVSDASFRITDDGSRPVCASFADDVTFQRVDVEAGDAHRSKGVLVNGSRETVTRNTIRDATVETGGPALVAVGGSNGVETLLVENFHNRSDGGVAVSGNVEFIQRGIY